MVEVKTRVNKSKEIRDILGQNADAKPAEIANELAERGIKVSPAFVSTIKHAFLHPESTSRGRKNRSAEGFVAITDLVEGGKFVRKVGGIENAKRVLEALSQLEG